MIGVTYNLRIMKAISRILMAMSLMTASILTTSCLKEQAPEAPEQKASAQEEKTLDLRLEVSGTSTKTYIDGETIYWSPEGESLLVCCLFSSENNNYIGKSKTYGYTLTDDGKAVFGASFNYAADASSFTVGAVYPWEDTGNFFNFRAYERTIPSTQTPAETSFDPAADILTTVGSMYAETFENLSSVPMSLKLARLVALGEMTIKGIEPGELIYSIEITSSESICGSVTLNLFSEKTLETAVYNKGGKTITLKMGDRAATGNDVVWFTALPSDLSGGTLSIRIKTDKAIYEKTADLSARTFRFDRAAVARFSVSGFTRTEDNTPPEPDHYISTDYSRDGKVTVLQTATEGNGINLVLMGDGYSDRQIADGLYNEDMHYVYERFFIEEPYKSFKHLFNVYSVDVVSATEGYEYGDTALKGYFGEGTAVGGNDNTCMSYALKQLSSSQLNESMIIVVMNSSRYAGTCWMYYPGSENKGYGSGLSIAYFPKGENPDVFAQLLHHEACGHGFAKLDDEYAYQSMGAVPSQDREECIQRQTEWGWSKNIDFTSDLATIRWNRFISDERYANDGLGAFEGAMTYWTGVYRPTFNSIMRYNTDGFNAPSREAIYYRIHKLAYGDEWQYDYEAFVAWDAINRKKASSTYQGGFVVESPILDPPVIVPYTWEEAYYKKF